ncbi:hypothetical protein KBA27_05960 [bacterium]|nr:hypothetical protein [bacterium]
MKNLKYLLILILGLFLTTQTSKASELLYFNINNDYMISTNSQIRASSVTDQNYLTIDQFCTLHNEKNSLLIHPVRTGKTQFVIIMKSGRYIFNVITSNDYPTDNKPVKKGIFTITTVDNPPDTDASDVNVEEEVHVHPTIHAEQDNAAFGLSNIQHPDRVIKANSFAPTKNSAEIEQETNSDYDAVTGTVNTHTNTTSEDDN